MRSVSLFRAVLFLIMILSASVAGFAQVGVGIVVSFGPPALPIYAQPVCPAPGWIWTPGYWAWDADFDDYYWVPGTWVLAQAIGAGTVPVSSFIRDIGVRLSGSMAESTMAMATLAEVTRVAAGTMASSITTAR